MKQISLTQGKIALVDDEVYEWAKDYKWHAFKHRNTFYVHRSFCDYNGRGTIKLHHAIIGYPLNGLIIDHIDGNGLNNQRSNLRIVTIRKNNQNTKKHRNGNLVGASWCKDRNKWLSQITINGKRKNLGRYDTEQEAHDVYVKAINELN